MSTDDMLTAGLLIALAVLPVVFVVRHLLGRREPRHKHKKVSPEKPSATEEVKMASSLSTKHQAVVGQLWSLQGTSAQAMQQIIQADCPTTNEVLKLILLRELLCLSVWASSQCIRDGIVAKELLRIYFEMPGINPQLDAVFLLSAERIKKRFVSYDQSWNREDSFQSDLLSELSTYIKEGANEAGITEGIKEVWQCIVLSVFFELTMELYTHMKQTRAIAG